MKRILIVAAENSAETYAVQVVEEFRRRHGDDVHFFGVGGRRLAALGVEILVPMESLAVVGVVEVVAHLRTLRRAMSRLLQAAIEAPADAVLLVDYPDFNLRLARQLKKRGIPVFSYICPTVWAWRYGRVKWLRTWLDHLFIIFPFEIPICRKERIPFTYVGHPLMQRVQADCPPAEFRRRLGVGERPLLALLPGSRASEVAALLPPMRRAAEAVARETGAAVCVLRAENIPRASLDRWLQGANFQVVEQADGYNLLHAASAVLTTHGTSNLEAALLDVPFVAAYRVNPISYHLGRHLVKIRHYSIVNILAGRPVVTELVQRECRAERMEEELLALLRDKQRRREMRAVFAGIRRMLAVEHTPAEEIHRIMAARLGLAPE